MSTQLPHDMLPHATHDELARQNFVQSLKVSLASKVSPGNKAVYEKRAKPRFEQEYKRAPQTRQEVRRVVREELEAVERGEVPESYETVVRTVSS